VRVAVIGGGIAGLAAAWQLHRDAEVTIFEPGRLGGKILTTEFGGRPVDEGPDAFLTRHPAAVELCDELGIGTDLVAPAAGRSLLWWRGRLRPIPEGLVLGVPQRLGRLATSGLLSPAGVARAGLDLVLPRRGSPEQMTVRELVAGRFGVQVADRLVDPLVGGIYAGRTDRLSAAGVVPQVVAAATRSRSLLLGLRRPAGAGAGAGPAFLAPRQGMAGLVSTLVETLKARSVAFVGQQVSGLPPGPGGRGAVVELASGSALDGPPFDGVVLAAPAPAAAAILGRHPSTSGAAPALLGIEYASVALVTMSFPRHDGGVQPPAGVNGFLVPRSEGRLMTACSFASSKWPHWAGPESVLVRLSAGRHGDLRATEMDDEALVATLAGELRKATGWQSQPERWRVSRWPEAFPQYQVGHARRVQRAEAELAAAAFPVVLAGAAYAGIGIPACIASGRSAARNLAGKLDQGPAAGSPE
jgi:oxygen-dependent protoporphyrinogen oxidase